MKALHTATAPAAVGPYSQAIDCGDYVFLSGQVPLDPKTGELVQGDITVQTNRVLDNIAAVLEAAGCSFDNVVKTTIFLVNLAHYKDVNAAYARRFTGPPPARSMVQVAALPR